MSWGILLLLAGISSPSIRDGDAGWLRSHYPAWAVRENKSAATFVEAVIEPDGKMHDCAVVGFVGDERLAAQECEILSRLKFRPATGADGTPMRGRYRNLLKRVLSGPQASLAASASRPPDLTLTVNQTDGSAQPLDIGIDLLIDATGSLATCHAGFESEGERYASFVRVACAQAGKLTFAPLAHETGEPYVTDALVRFVTGASASQAPKG